MHKSCPLNTNWLLKHITYRENNKTVVSNYMFINRFLMLTKSLLQSEILLKSNNREILLLFKMTDFHFKSIFKLTYSCIGQIESSLALTVVSSENNLICSSGVFFTLREFVLQSISTYLK